MKSFLGIIEILRNIKFVHALQILGTESNNVSHFLKLPDHDNLKSGTSLRSCSGIHTLGAVPVYRMFAL